MRLAPLLACGLASLLCSLWPTRCPWRLAVPLFTHSPMTPHPASAPHPAPASRPHQGIFVDSEGFVSEGPNMNIACLMQDGTLVVGAGFGAGLACLLAACLPVTACGRGEGPAGRHSARM